MSQPEIKTRRQLVSDIIRRVLTYTTEITYFGPNSVGLAFAEATAAATSGSYRLYRALLRRQTLLASSGEATTAIAEEKGAERKGGQRSGLFVIVQPHKARVLAITSGATDLIEVDDSTAFDPGDSIRIRDSAGGTEIATIIAITTGTGPNSGDELEVATLAGSYTPDPAADDVTVLLRFTVPAGTEITTSAGVSFETLANVTAGDANPVLDGEATFLGLADKVFAEAVETGSIGNVDPLSVSGFATPIPKILSVFNPERGMGGADSETDFDLKFRAAHGPARASQETEAWVETLAKAADDDVLRAIRTSTNSVATMAIRVLPRNGTVLSAARRDAIAAYITQRVRSYMQVEVLDVVLTSVVVSAQITLDADADLRSVWLAASVELAKRIDYRKRQFGDDVDEAVLLSVVRSTPGVASLVTSSFLPAADVVVADESLPILTQLTLTDTATNETINAPLTVSF